MRNSAASRVAGLILAAGSASRMGQPKQLLPWKQTTVLNHVIAQAQPVVDTVFVVLGADYESIRTGITHKVEIINNSHWTTGMSSSIATGIREIADAQEYNAALILLADQPLFTAAHFQEMIQRVPQAETPIVCTQYPSGKCGAPAVFHRDFFAELQSLDGDSGAKKLIAQHRSELICMDPKGMEKDIDTLKSYHSLYDRWGRP